MGHVETLLCTGEVQPRELPFNTRSLKKPAQMAVCPVSTVLIYTQAIGMETRSKL